MRKLKLLLVACIAMCGLGANAADLIIDQRLTNVAALEDKLFAIVNEDEGKALCFTSNHNLNYESTSVAFTSNSFYFLAEAIEGTNYYYLRSRRPDGSVYEYYGGGGYLNSQAATGSVCFTLRVDTDIADGSTWALEVNSEGKFAIKNIGTGLYLKNGGAANNADPTYFTFCTLMEDPIPAATEKYNALKDKYLAINSSLNVAEADALLASAETLDDVQAAINKLITTFAIYLANVEGETDLTSFITNPSFESNFTGWTNSGMSTQDNTSFPGKVGSKYCEAWQPNGTKSVSQTLTGLIQGAYRISANSLARGVTSAKLYAGSRETAITIADASNTYDVVFFTDGTDVTIGFEGVGNGAGSSWLCVDNFQLTYVENMTEEEFVDYAAFLDAKAVYDKLYAEAMAFDVNTLPTKAKQAFQTALDRLQESYSTTALYNTMSTYLRQGLDLAKSVVDPYAEYLETKAAAETMKDADTYTGDEAKLTFETALSTTSDNVENAENAETIETQTNNLRAAAKTFVMNVTIKADQCLDLTCLIKNPHFKFGEGGNKVATGWTLAEGGWITEHRLATHNFEAWHAHFDLSQTITDLPKGTYKVTLQGFARHDDANVTNKTSLYCGPLSQIIKDINDEYSETSYYSNAQTPMGDTNRDRSYTEGGKTVYRPNGMTGAYYWFQEENPLTHQPFYTSEVQTIMDSDGDLKIGFKCEADQDWVLWDNFHLYYYGSAIKVTIDEDEAGSVYEKDIENANITLKRTFNAGIWNTISLPFDLSDTETKAAFGSTAEVATYSEEADGTNSTVSFIKATDAAITANTPVLLKTSTTSTEFSFNGKTIKAGESKAEGTNFDFVGTYAASSTIAEGDYFIANDKLWKSTGATTIKGTRAYLKAKAAEARIVGFSFDGDETTAIEGLEIMNSNNGKLYNLNGQEVKNAQKGLYIQNGKKVIFK